MSDDRPTPIPAPSKQLAPRSRRHPWLALTLGGSLPAALATAHAPWLAVAVVGLLCESLIAAIYVFMEGAGPAREWAAVRDQRRERA